DEAIEVVEGKRAPLPLAPSQWSPQFPEVDALAGLPDRESGFLLAASRELRDMRENLRSGKIYGWRDFGRHIKAFAGSDANVTKLLVEASRAKDPNADAAMASSGNDNVLPNRIHLFHRTLSGLWTCVNAQCPKRPLASDRSDWPYGAVF